MELLGGVRSGTVSYPISEENSVLSRPVGCRMVVISIRTMQLCILFVRCSLDVQEDVREKMRFCVRLPDREFRRVIFRVGDFAMEVRTLLYPRQQR